MIFPFTEEIYNPSVTNVNYKNAIHFLLPLNYLILKNHMTSLRTLFQVHIWDANVNIIVHELEPKIFDIWLRRVD